MKFQRSQTSAGQRMPSTFRPLLCRRSKTFTESPRFIASQSRQPSTSGGLCVMPRSHVSVARFYDWSDDESYSVSKLYREIANIPQLSSDRLAGLQCHIVPSYALSPLSPLRNPSVSPGRMFLRDKKALTRGEREIIEGIYKNRSDFDSKVTGCATDLQVKSHQDAWSRKSPDHHCFSRVLLKGEKISGKTSKQDSSESPHLSTSDQSNASTPDSLRIQQNHSKTKPGPGTVRNINCGVCQSEIRPVADSRTKLLNNNFWESSPAAPPCTPESATSRGQPKQFPVFDKLLSARQSMNTNPNLLAVKSPRGYKNGHTNGYLNGHYSDSTKLPNLREHGSNQSLIRQSYSPVPAIATHDESLSQIQGREQDTGQILSAGEATHSSDLYGTANWVLQNDRYDKGVYRPDGVRRKVHVQVYVPTAGEDHVDDDVTCVLTKERPLSHSKFKHRSSNESVSDRASTVTGYPQ
ncbi:uncharacterized protein LOC131936527 [Physella acuta]|uniref:uncharacterized protein LOC131936527 n=1 Tax=Physella acuta TaxID=109671 RepID=UPI0027DCB7B7|nr:uncharacterized protein LOC131936527 [Physella acuta]